MSALLAHLSQEDNQRKIIQQMIQRLAELIYREKVEVNSLKEAEQAARDLTHFLVNLKLRGAPDMRAADLEHLVQNMDRRPHDEDEAQLVQTLVGLYIHVVNTRRFQGLTLPDARAEGETVVLQVLAKILGSTDAAGMKDILLLAANQRLSLRLNEEDTLNFQKVGQIWRLAFTLGIEARPYVFQYLRDNLPAQEVDSKGHQWIQKYAHQGGTPVNSWTQSSVSSGTPMSSLPPTSTGAPPLSSQELGGTPGFSTTGMTLPASQPELQDPTESSTQLSTTPEVENQTPVELAESPGLQENVPGAMSTTPHPTGQGPLVVQELAQPASTPLEFGNQTESLQPTIQEEINDPVGGPSAPEAVPAPLTPAEIQADKFGNLPALMEASQAFAYQEKDRINADFEQAYSIFYRLAYQRARVASDEDTAVMLAEQATQCLLSDKLFVWEAEAVKTMRTKTRDLRAQKVPNLDADLEKACVSLYKKAFNALFFESFPENECQRQALGFVYKTLNLVMGASYTQLKGQTIQKAAQKGMEVLQKRSQLLAEAYVQKAIELVKDLPSPENTREHANAVITEILHGRIPEADIPGRCQRSLLKYWPSSVVSP